MCKRLVPGLVLVVAALGYALPGSSAEESAGAYGVGRPASDAEIRAWDIDVASSGEGLPPGQGTVKQGAQAYAAKQYAIAQSRFNEAAKYVTDKSSPQGLKVQDYQGRLREIRGR